jgi:iron-sulfur cluster repair protein YtfE (RIC family)
MTTNQKNVSTKEDSDSAVLAAKQRRRKLFGDCALVEIIHLHDCLRGALKALHEDVSQLNQSVMAGNVGATELERRVAGRFKVIWSVFRAHSAAEDEFIWPALQSKTDQSIGSEKQNINNHEEPGPSIVEHEEYVEDHADEERMFKSFDELLSKLRDGLVKHDIKESSIHDVAKAIHELTASLMQHLMAHLEKEETQCMPLVVKHLTKSEIHDLVGQIMGKRSSETIAQIMAMAVQNLNDTDREDMVHYMKQAMVGTFFEKWLAMSGWMTSETGLPKAEEEAKILSDSKRDLDDAAHIEATVKRARIESESDCSDKVPLGVASLPIDTNSTENCSLTTQADLEKLIRAIAGNQALTPMQKNTTMQGLRDSVWKSNQRHSQVRYAFCAPLTAGTASAASRSRRETPPSSYFKKKDDGGVELTWSRESSVPPGDVGVPLFSASELAPTYHDGANGAVLGCPHYARACKLRHPSSGRLYTCRLCCEQDRENPLKDQDSPLDRYAVAEIFCMRCTTLQPAGEHCINPKCDSHGSPFAKYNCKICNLYDDGPTKKIYHCPFCNVCRSGEGLGIDYRHCMRCNACVSLGDDEHHCISQKLQGSCPICHETMFQSTEPLRGLKCGHVMHLSCFTMYIRGQAYTCPLCKKSVEDMKEYFAMLDAAVRMQPMPAAYSSTMSNVYCQDCENTGQVPYHFVGCKCPKCGSYNTRELGRVQGSPL